MNRLGAKPLLAIAASVLIAMPLQAALPRKLPPVEKCGGDPSFDAFRSELRRVVARRDPQAFLRLLAPDVTVNFGGDSGRKSFADQWEINSPAKTGLWRELAAILHLGCARIEQARVMPSLHAEFSAENDQDPFEMMIVVSPKAQLRTSRQSGSRVVTTLGWDVVKAIQAPDDSDKIKVRLADGREGWLKRTELRSPLDYRLVMEKRRGKWMITAFVAGD